MLSGCGGGGIQSPGFKPVLAGFVITTIAENGGPALDSSGNVVPVMVVPAAKPGEVTVIPTSSTGERAPSAKVTLLLDTVKAAPVRVTDGAHTGPLLPGRLRAVAPIAAQTLNPVSATS